MNQSGVTGVPGATGPSRTQWLVFTAVVVCLALVAGGVLYLLPVLELLGNHDAAPGRGVPAPAHAPPPLDSKQRINILLLGSDNDQKFPQDALLSQTMIVVSVDPAHHQVTLLSLLRDLWVEIPGHGQAKIDLAYARGGAPLARATVEKAFKIPIHYYAWVGLKGLVRVVDRVGGIDVDVLHPVLDDNYPNDFNDSGYGTERVYLAAGPPHLHGPPPPQYGRPPHCDLLSGLGRPIPPQPVVLAPPQPAEGMGLGTGLPALAKKLKRHGQNDP